jgi:SAM-dependent methyltransferase
MKIVLNLGCGEKKIKSAINVDISPEVKPDLIVNLNSFPYPFKDNTFDEIIANHILEHLESMIKVMKELHRISKPNAIIKIEVPYFAHPEALYDPTHKSFFTYFTFDHFDETTLFGKTSWLSKNAPKFKIVKKEFVFTRFLKLLGLPLIARTFPSVYENYLSRIFPAARIRFELKVIKK